MLIVWINSSSMHFYVFQPFCKSVEPVCGHNGETYSSVCAAYSDRVAVDYYGHCQAVGVLSDYGFHTECAFVKCPQLSATGCKPVIAPGMLIQCWSLLHVGVPRLFVLTYVYLELNLCSKILNSIMSLRHPRGRMKWRSLVRLEQGSAGTQRGDFKVERPLALGITFLQFLGTCSCAHRTCPGKMNEVCGA